MLPDRVSNPGPLTYESGALPIALHSLANTTRYHMVAQGTPRLHKVPQGGTRYPKIVPLGITWLHKVPQGDTRYRKIAKGWIFGTARLVKNASCSSRFTEACI